MQDIYDCTTQYILENQEKLYRLAYSYVQEYDATKNPVLLKNAISYFDKVIDQFPGGDMAKDALSVKASCYEIQGKHVEAAEVREKLLQAPYSNGMSYAKKYEIVKKIDFSRKICGLSPFLSRIIVF